MSDDVSLCAVGDVAAFYRQPETMFTHTAEILKSADVTFAQNERLYTNRYTEKDLVPGVPVTEISPREHAAALKLGGFDVMSFASNHCMDLGAGAMMETVSALRECGFSVIGAGNNIAEAREPAIVERRGTKIGFLAYCSVLRPGWEAGAEKAGCAPLRASTFYQQVDFQPGTPPAIISIANRADLEAMQDDIKKLRPLVDVLVISCHWGLHFIRGTIAMYEREIAHAAIDAGADLIVGHHPHVLKGIEMYKGKAVFYSMGNFAFDLPLSVRMARRKARPERYHINAEIDPDYAEWNCFPAESRISMIVKCQVKNKAIDRVSFLPVLINQRAQPYVVSEDAEIQAALENMIDLTKGEGMTTKFSREGTEIVVSA